MRWLDLANNQFSGPIPSRLAEISSLEVLTLGGNDRLTGCIPDALHDVRRNDLAEIGLPVCEADDVSTGAAAQTPAPITPISERDALAALYRATDGPNWSNSRNWLSEAPLGEWHGITTDGSGQRQRAASQE